MSENSQSLNALVLESKESERVLGYNAALEALERAHILSQPFPWPHLYIHWLMFTLALRHRVFKEALGQVPRLMLAMPGSWIGRAPRGNVGSTKMGIFEEK